MNDERLKLLKSRAKTREFCPSEWLELIEEVENLQRTLSLYANESFYEEIMTTSNQGFNRTITRIKDAKELTLKAKKALI